MPGPCRPLPLMHPTCTPLRASLASRQHYLTGFTLLLSLLLVGGATRAQGPPLPLARLAVVRDSLNRLLTHDTRPDTQRVSRLNILAFALRVNAADTSLILARQALRLARPLRFERGLLEALLT